MKKSAKHTQMTQKLTVQEMVADILKRPYARMVIPDSDGTYVAEIAEFPGCFAVGDSAVDALDTLEEVAADWIASSVAQGQNIPEPMNAAGYSGKLVLRMQKSLHQRAALYAERDGVSLNQFIVTCIAERVGVRAQPIAIGTAPVLQTVYAPLALVQALIVAPSQQSYATGFAAVSSEAAPYLPFANAKRVAVNA